MLSKFEAGVDPRSFQLPCSALLWGLQEKNPDKALGLFPEQILMFSFHFTCETLRDLAGDNVHYRRQV
jgi:hypothetical protein